MYKCFHCGAEAVGWCSDADFEDIGREGEGVVHFLECGSCGARITYEVGDEAEAEAEQAVEEGARWAS